MGVAQTKPDALAERIAKLAYDPAGALAPARAAALERLSTMGLSGPRDEYWRYTSPARLNTIMPDTITLPTAQAGTDEMALFAALNPIKIVFCDGQFDPAQSDKLAADGLEITRLADTAAPMPPWAKALYGTLETTGQQPVPRPMAAMNTAFASDGLILRATAANTRPVWVIYQNCHAQSDAILHHTIRVEGGAKLTLLESGHGAARMIQTSEVDIAASGQFHHIRTQGTGHSGTLNTHIFARLGAEALFKSFSLSANGAWVRNETVLELNGDAAIAHTAGASLTKGDVLHDDSIFITHAAPGCESRQVFKKVLKAGAKAVFQGKILVKQIAQKTDGYQTSQSLLLDEDSQFLAKPELEIYADDVKCSHGSTSGALDETALFYLQSRGVPRTQAAVLLVIAFLAEALDEIANPEISETLQVQLEAWLADFSATA